VLALPGRAAHLATLGLTSVVVKLNADDEDEHDALARVPGAWLQTQEGIRQLQERRIPVVVVKRG